MWWKKRIYFIILLLQSTYIYKTLIYFILFYFYFYFIIFYYYFKIILIDKSDSKEDIGIVIDSKNENINKTYAINGEERKFYINGYDCVIGMVVGIISIAIFGWIFHKDFYEGLALLLLPSGMSVEGESLGAFLAAPLGTLFGIFVSAGIRTLVNGSLRKD